MGIKRQKKKCKCGCGKEGYIFGHGLIESCYRREYAKKQKAKEVKDSLFSSDSPISSKKKERLARLLRKTRKIKQRSSSNTYSDSFGNRFTSDEIELKIKKAKKLFQEWFIEEHGYIYCEECKRQYDQNGMEALDGCSIIDISHTISVKEAKETGRVELCWDWENNFRHLGRTHHQIHDKLR